MNSNEIENQISEVTRRANALERRLKVVQGLDDGLTLQRELDSLQSLKKRLQSQLAEAQQRESAIQKENEQLALETELDSLRTSYQNNCLESNELVNKLTEAVVQAVPGLDKLSSERTQLQSRFESAFHQRYGRELGRLDRLEAQGLEHAEFSDKVAGLLAGIGNELIYQKRAERRRNGS